MTHRALPKVNLEHRTRIKLYSKQDSTSIKVDLHEIQSQIIDSNVVILLIFPSKEFSPRKFKGLKREKTIQGDGSQHRHIKLLSSNPISFWSHKLI